MIFFDKSYVDISLRARLKRQKRQFNDSLINKLKILEQLSYSIGSILYKIKNKINVKFNKHLDIFDQERWSCNYFNNPTKMSNSGKEDLTVDGYINKYGGIKSNLDEKIYTNKAAYMDHIKQSGKTIKDW